MFKNHPKGLIVLFFTEMWERFGFYTMLAIFVFYLQESFGWDQATVTNIYGIFLAGVYFTPIIGGWLADNVLGYGKTITIGAITMAIGYSMMAIPTQSEATSATNPFRLSTTPCLSPPSSPSPTQETSTITQTTPLTTPSETAAQQPVSSSSTPFNSSTT